MLAVDHVAVLARSTLICYRNQRAILIWNFVDENY